MTDKGNMTYSDFIKKLKEEMMESDFKAEKYISSLVMIIEQQVVKAEKLEKEIDFHKTTIGTLANSLSIESERATSLYISAQIYEEKVNSYEQALKKITSKIWVVDIHKIAQEALEK